MELHINDSTEATVDVSVKNHDDISASVDDTSASVVYDTSTEASVNAGIKTTDVVDASVEAGVSVKTGTVASASGGLDGNNAFVEVSYSDTTEAHITVDASVDYEGVGAEVSGDAYAKSGNELDAHVKVGENGVDVGANVSSGSCVGVDGSSTVNMREASATVGGGVNVGDHFEAGGSGQATFEDGKATIGVSGDIAALVGLEVDVSVSIDTNQIQEDTEALKRLAESEEAKRVAEQAAAAQKAAEDEARRVAEQAAAAQKAAEKEARRVAEQAAAAQKAAEKEARRVAEQAAAAQRAAEDAANAAKRAADDAAKAAANAAKNTGNSISNAFKKLFR